MQRRDVHRRIRKWHRYLGVFFGIQFLFWTIGGLYFSWTNIKTVRGDDVRKEVKRLQLPDSISSIGPAIQALQQQYPNALVDQVQLVNNASMLPLYQIRYSVGEKVHHLMVDAQTGKTQASIDENKAVEIAKQTILRKTNLVDVYKVTSTNGHHEYREKPLPAFAVVLSGETNCTVYVGEETGLVHSIRNNQWRVFDFLWMLHIMDFKERDNINNWILRISSLMGLITLLSGYALYFISRKKHKKT
jgi:uncharacterized iron-regulated membrane protein